MRKSFVMLAAPGMIGKSTAAKRVSGNQLGIHVLPNDELMHRIFKLVRLHDPTNIPINKMEKWREKVNAEADCGKLIRLFHRDEVAPNWQKNIILAEGYTYMADWYRNEVYKGLAHLGYTFDYYLLQYFPPKDQQILRRDKKYQDWGWGSKTDDFHREELTREWLNFEVPVVTDEGVIFEQVDDEGLARVIKHIADGYA